MKTNFKLLAIFALLMGVNYSAFSQWWPTGNVVNPGEFLGSINNQALNFRTNGVNRMRLMETGVNTVEGYTYNHDGFLMLSMDPNGFNYKPFSLLHLNGLGNHSWGPQPFGYRDWMKAGIIFTHNRDFMYVGPMSNGLDKTDAVIAWADNKESGDIGPDVLRFLFTNRTQGSTTISSNVFGTGISQGDGLRIFDNSGGPGHLDLWTSSSTQTHIRWSGNGTIQGINSRFELLANYKGFWFNTTNINGQYIFNQEGTEVGRIGTNNNWRIGLNPSNVNAQRRLEVFDNSNKPQFRITYAINAGANSDFQVSSEGNLHVVPQTSGNVGALAIGFFPDDLSPPTTETFLDVGNKGITRFISMKM